MALTAAFDKNIGSAATTPLLLVDGPPNEHKDAMKQIAWPTVLLVAGVTMDATILTTAKALEFVGRVGGRLGAVAIGAPILAYVGGVGRRSRPRPWLLPVTIPIGYR